MSLSLSLLIFLFRLACPDTKTTKSYCLHLQLVYFKKCASWSSVLQHFHFFLHWRWKFYSTLARDSESVWASLMKKREAPEGSRKAFEDLRKASGWRKRVKKQLEQSNEQKKVIGNWSSLPKIFPELMLPETRVMSFKFLCLVARIPRSCSP